MDLTNLTLAGLAGIGITNVLSFFVPDMDSRIKFAVSLAAIFAVTFVPVEIGNVVLDHAKTALTVAFASSGVYKLAQKAGGESSGDKK